MTASLAILSLIAFLAVYELIDANWDRGRRPVPASAADRDFRPAVSKGG